MYKQPLQELYICERHLVYQILKYKKFHAMAKPPKINQFIKKTCIFNFISLGFILTFGSMIWCIMFGSCFEKCSRQF